MKKEKLAVGLAGSNEGNRLQVLRGLLGMNQSELSEKTGISQSLISQIERGNRSASEAVIASIARATDTPITFFFQDASPLPGALSFRKAASAPAKQKLENRFDEIERIGLRISADVKFRDPKLPYFRQEDTVAIDLEQIERISQETRNVLGLDRDGAIRNLTRAMERRGILVVPIATRDEELFVKHDGATRPTHVQHRPLVTYVAGGSGDRERFSKAHELGHEILHSYRQDLPETFKEKEAHEYAGALLLPRAYMEEQVSESLNLNGYLLVKAQMGVSIQAIMKRAAVLELISERRYRSLMVQISSKGWRKNEPVSVAGERPILLGQMLKKKYGDRPMMQATYDLGIPSVFLSRWSAMEDMELTPDSTDQPVGAASQSASTNNVVSLFGRKFEAKKSTLG